MTDTTKRELKLEEIEWQGVIAYGAGKPLIANPYEEGGRYWWMWRLAWLREQERDEHEALPSTQAERAIEEQPRWERRHRLGVPVLLERVHARADMLGDLLGVPFVPIVLLDEHRNLLRTSVEELLTLDPERSSS